jgi:hypothetical protein
MSTDNSDLLKIAESTVIPESLDFSKNNEYSIKYLRELIQEFNIQVGIAPGNTIVRPVFLFDYLIEWAKPLNLIGKSVRPKVDKKTMTWLGRELKHVYNIEYNANYFLLNVDHFLNFDLNEYNPDSILMMRKYKVKHDAKKKKEANQKDKIFQKENKDKEKKDKAFKKLLRSKERSKG